jgi:hypothetical protein
LEDFTEAQMAEFLTRLYGGDAGKAQARLHLIHEIKDLLGLAHNPRMLGFIADLDEQRLRDVQARTGTISSADLYEELVTTWLDGEEKRRHTRGSVRSLTAGELRAAVTALALRLWEAPDRGIGLADLTDAASGVLADVGRERRQPYGRRMGCGVPGGPDGSRRGPRPLAERWPGC